MSNHRRIIHTAIYTPGLHGRWGLSLLFQGPPGVGKTSEIQECAHTMGFQPFAPMGERAFETLIASIRTPEDFGGLPIPDEEGGIEHRAFAWARRLAQHERGLLYLDELKTAPPAVQAALLRVVFEGVVGDFELPKGIRFIAATNRTGESAGGWDLAPPLANRFCHLPWPAPSASEWSEWMLSGAAERDDHVIDPAKEEARVEKRWLEEYGAAKGIVTAFLGAKPSAIYQQPKDGSADASGAWASPRTWEMATRAIAGARVHGLSEVDRDVMVAGCVGEGPAGELGNFMREADLPDPADLLDGKIGFKADHRIDRTMAVLSSCVAMILDPKLKQREKRIPAFWEKVAGPISDSSPDLLAVSLKTMRRAVLTRQDEGKESDPTSVVHWPQCRKPVDRLSKVVSEGLSARR